MSNLGLKLRKARVVEFTLASLLIAGPCVAEGFDGFRSDPADRLAGHLLAQLGVRAAECPKDAVQGIELSMVFCGQFSVAVRDSVTRDRIDEILAPYVVADGRWVRDKPWSRRGLI